jgi:CheY-like chemotaxis protein
LSEKKVMLFVDDDLIMIKLLKNVLSAAYKDEFLYATALSAVDALKDIEKLYSTGVEVALIISDWLMPEMKGDEFILKIHEDHPEIKTIMISGYASPQVIENICEKLKLSAFITKPWDVNVLISEINKCLNIKQTI